jgi:putative transcriptional regulator
MAEDAVEAALARIMRAPREIAVPVRPARGILPAPLQDYVGGDLDAVRWRPVGMGVRQAILPTDRAASARLLHIPAGVAMPGHGHGGLEMTMVISGAFVDEGRRYGPGDVELADEATEHTPVAEAWADCICIAASDAKLRFTGLLPRLAQPFFRI